MQDEFIRRALIVNVVDGDTFDAIVDLGFTVTVNVRFRLKGIDTPEIYRPSSQEELDKGREAKALVSALILDQQVWIKSFKMGVYNRWEGEVFLKDTGESLAEILINKGYAT